MPYRLSPADRERFGCQEWLADVNSLAISVADLEELSERFDFNPSDWPAPFVGEITLEQAGDPDAVAAPPRWQGRALFWMLLHQNGHPVSWDEAGTVQVGLAEYRPVEVVAEGKAPSRRSTGSRRSASSTTPRSSKSSGSPKSKSTS